MGLGDARRPAEAAPTTAVNYLRRAIALGASFSWTKHVLRPSGRGAPLAESVGAGAERVPDAVTAPDSAPASVRRMLRPVSGLAGAALFGLVLGVLVRIAGFVVAAEIVRLLAVVGGWVAHLVPSADPVYTSAALDTLGNIHPGRLAVSGVVGEQLHSLAPEQFANPARSGIAMARWVPVPGSAALAILVTSCITQILVLSVGLSLAWHGSRHGRWRLLAVGTGVQLAVALSVIGRPPGIEELESTGLSFAFNALLSRPGSRASSLTLLTSGWQPALRQGALALMAMAIVYSLALLAVRLSASTRRLLSLLRPSGSAQPQPRPPAIGPRLLLVSLAVGISGCTSVAVGTTTALAPDSPPLQFPGTVGASAPQPPQVGSARSAEPPSTPLAALPAKGMALATVEPAQPTAALAAATPMLPPPAAPSVVQVIGAKRQFAYLVNGRREVIRGMGINTQYANQLSPPARRERMKADFAAMKAMGVNTILGWDPAEFDDVTLQIAAEQGLGVVLPLELDPFLDYADPAVRQRLTQEVLATVQRYRKAPALRMWGLGNEVLHKLVHPSWVAGAQDPNQAAKATAFASWLIATADAVHALDPYHPVTYRDAEDAFTSWVVDALRRDGGRDHSWFVYGTNVYQDHLVDILNNWPKREMGVALWVSEFAPGGLPIPDRAEGFKRMWGYIRRDPNWVFGGAVYAWTRNGPEEIDRNLGLTDDGVPADGRSLAAIAEVFGQPTAAVP